MSSLISRDLLNLALNHINAGELKTISSGTYIDYLPKDVIQYLQGYTGPVECYYVVESRGTDEDDNEVDYCAWVNTSYQEVRRGLRNSSVCVFDGDIVFVDGKPHLLHPLKKLYGLKKSKMCSKRCSGKNQSGRRCRNRVSSKSLCFIHDVE